MSLGLLVLLIIIKEERQRQREIFDPLVLASMPTAAGAGPQPRQEPRTHPDLPCGWQ